MSFFPILFLYLILSVQFLCICFYIYCPFPLDLEYSLEFLQSILSKFCKSQPLEEPELTMFVLH